MEIVDPFGENGAKEEEVEVADGVQLGVPLTAQARNEAIAIGRLIGEREAESRGEEGDLREGRIKRAMAYAAWEFDGYPAGEGERYETEFGIGVFSELRHAVGHSGPDYKAGKKKKGE